MMEVIYKGDLRTEALHTKSGNKLLTDAPVDNKGKGEAFSPTDLVATALASCMLTVMGIKARELNISIEGAKATIEKIMASNPRRISELQVTIYLPENYEQRVKEILEKVAKDCPVAKSIHPETKQHIVFIYP